ncbi:MAG: hypothetical protein AAB426_10300 [Myxococcota bacterium]
MLRLLTDEHISPAVAAAARGICAEMEIISLRDWQHGHLLSASDEALLHEARNASLTLVTYDLRTIPVLLRAWAEQDIDHAGVVLVDEKTIGQAEVGALADALCSLWRAQRQHDWHNRVVFLRRRAQLPRVPPV